MDKSYFPETLIRFRTAGWRLTLVYVRALAKSPEGARARENVLAAIPFYRQAASPKETLTLELRRQRALRKHRPALYCACHHMTLTIAFGAECHRLMGRSPSKEG
ncbi:MAG: hypothetical protein EP347_10330 [Alphaproteobacteria bacterium]|nr:MAG: hypothetical protein EP347_10330 [Alphaproteobacteria bacterium]